MSDPQQIHAQGMEALGAKDFERALELFQSLCRSDPVQDEPWYQLSQAYAGLGDMGSCEAAATTALKFNPVNLGALIALGACRCNRGDWQGCADLMTSVLSLCPHMPSAHWNRATCNLSFGNWKQGFADYEYGFITRHRTPRFPMRQWDGRQVDRLFVWGEQGYGDQIMFSRFAQRAKYIAGRVTLEVKPNLYRLMAAQNVAHEVTLQADHYAAPIRFDAHVPLMSIPFETGCPIKQPESLRAPGYSTWNIGGGKKTIGLVWRGNALPNPMRSMAFEDLKPLLDTVDADYFAFGLSCDAEHPRMKCIGPSFADWADTADALEKMDCFVSIDTGAAHLAAAMGKPTYVAAINAHDWRWANTNGKSWWYESATVIPQQRPADWSTVVERLIKELG